MYQTHKCRATAITEGENFIETSGQHNHAYFSESHPSIWKMIANLQKDASVQKLNFYNASSGHQFTKKKKYRVLNEKVQNIMHVYEEKTDFNFFRAMVNLS